MQNPLSSFFMLLRLLSFVRGDDSDMILSTSIMSQTVFGGGVDFSV